MTDNPIPNWYRAVTERAAKEAPTVPEATALATDYSVSCVPENCVDAFIFSIRVQYRGSGRYAVIRGGDMCLGSDGTWDHGVKEYDRGQAWLDHHRFDLDTALRLAKEQAALVTVNGHTVSDVLAIQKNREENRG
ncbi:hypothetical protein PV382_44500 [Streptomyces scabiei]|uniref:hypothetical protein n=1 Tax=Streptomyces scabiei TaxID=1930 RepID=UPI000765CB12|nr:hypothetical protein [Streptomyces scabiei]MDX2999471.1 hypothetical protein [Streptomyces scabiei]MDX3053481.1 hypothetical protein [Streptomyces scabiei]MDX3179247.1 hypothetical protein [Streptomyces scabiei]